MTQRKRGPAPLVIAMLAAALLLAALATQADAAVRHLDGTGAGGGGGDDGPNHH